MTTVEAFEIIYDRIYERHELGSEKATQYETELQNLALALLDEEEQWEYFEGPADG